jgi:hypothetical protein
MFGSEVDAAIQRFSDELAAEHPEIADIIERIKQGDLNELQAMQALMGVAHAKGLGMEIERLAEGAFGAVQEMRRAPENELVVPKEGEGPPVIYGEHGVHRLNPLYEAALAERAQFDGDIPELRSGVLPEGGTPAVPVDTMAMNPVALGAMLEQASDEVKGELNEKVVEVEGQVKALLEDAAAEGVDAVTALATRDTSHIAVPHSVPGYEAGSLPALRKVEVTGLATMSEEDRKRAAWKSVSTTQGRRSALQPIEQNILRYLESNGYGMDCRKPSKLTDPPVYAEWTMQITGEGDTNPSFSPVAVAARSLGRRLLAQLKADDAPTIDNPVLEVATIDKIDVRRVGWAARVVPRGA